MERTWVHLTFWRSCCSIINFLCCILLTIVFVFLFLYPLVIVLPVLLRFTASHHHKSSNHYVFLPFRLDDKRDDFNFAITNFPPLDSTTCTQPLPRVEFLFHSLYVMLEVAVFIQTIHNVAVLNQGFLKKCIILSFKKIFFRKRSIWCQLGIDDRRCHWQLDCGWKFVLFHCFVLRWPCILSHV